MDVGLWSGIVGAAAGAIAVPIAWYYGHRSSASGKPRIQVRMVGEYVTYELPGNGGLKMDQFVILKAYNLGDRPVTIVGWGLKLPGSSGNRAVFDSPKSLETQLPYRLEPGDIPAKFFSSRKRLPASGKCILTCRMNAWWVTCGSPTTPTSSPRAAFPCTSGARRDPDGNRMASVPDQRLQVQVSRVADEAGS